MKLGGGLDPPYLLTPRRGTRSPDAAMVVRSAVSLASVLGTVLVGLAACSSSTDATSPPTTCPGVELVAAASDYLSSVVCGAPPCELGPRTSSADLGKDPLLTASNGRVFYLVRDKDTIYELDPTCGTAIPPRIDVRQPDISNAGAHDIAAAKDGTLFVALYSVPRILVLGKDGTQELAIDLSMYDPDGNPQADSIAISEVGGFEKAFVTLERLDNSPAAVGTSNFLRSNQSSMMLRIDVATRTVEAAVPLEGRNPFNTIREHAGAYFLAEPGNFDAIDETLSGIERFDTATSTTKLLVHEKDLGGSVAEVAVTEGCGAAIIAATGVANPTSLITFDPATGAALTSAAAPLLATDGFDLQGLTWSGDTLYVGDRRATGARYPIHVYTREPGTCILHDSGRTVTLPQKPVAFRPAR